MFCSAWSWQIACYHSLTVSVVRGEIHIGTSQPLTIDDHSLLLLSVCLSVHPSVTLPLMHLSLSPCLSLALLFHVLACHPQSILSTHKHCILLFYLLSNLSSGSPIQHFIFVTENWNQRTGKYVPLSVHVIFKFLYVTNFSLSHYLVAALLIVIVVKNAGSWRNRHRRISFSGKSTFWFFNIFLSSLEHRLWEKRSVIY